MVKSKKKSSDKKMMDALDKRFTEMGEQKRFGNEIIIQQDVGDAVMDYMKIFGANKNLYRVVPFLISGMRPGRTRLYYAWWEREGRPQNTRPETLSKLKFYKVERLTSDSEKYHPHGTASQEVIIGRDGQYWSNNAMLIVPQGGYGNMRHEKPGAGRYINAMLSEYCIDCFFDEFDYYCVPMRLNYNGDAYEPLFLPAKYPHVLFNPQFSGIGYGLASNIPPFNVTEVLDATIKLIKNPDAKILLYPDSPTGCDIIDSGEFKEINKTGNGKFTMQASYEIDYAENKITITSLPINSDSDTVIKSIIAMNKKGDFKNTKIVDINDSTKEGKVLIEIFLDKDAKPDKFMKKILKKNTGLRAGFAVGLNVIDDFQNYNYGVKRLLLEWIEYRFDVVLSMMLNKLQKLIDKKHGLDALVIIFENNKIDKAIDIAKTSKSKAEVIERYMKEFKFTSVQAEGLAEFKIYQMNANSKDKIIKETKEIEKQIKEVDGIIDDSDKLKEFVINQLEEGKKKWGHKRKSRIIKDTIDVDDIPDTEHIIGVTESGWIKKLDLKHNSSIGKIGKSGSSLTVIEASNRENLLLIDSTGMVIKIPVSTIPDMVFEDIGVELKKFFSVKGDIKAIMELPSDDLLNQGDEFNILFMTKRGCAKRVKLSEFRNMANNKKSGITLDEGDELAVATFSFNEGDKDIIICTNQGDGLRLPLDELRLYGSNAKGLKMISLKEDEEVVSVSIVNPKKKLLLYITNAGRVKTTELKYFPKMDRKGEAVSLISLQNGETLLGVSSVGPTDLLQVYHKTGEPETLEISSLEPTTRIAKGEKKFKTNRGDSIIAYKVFKK